MRFCLTGAAVMVMPALALAEIPPPQSRMVPRSQIDPDIVQQ